MHRPGGTYVLAAVMTVAVVLTACSTGGEPAEVAAPAAPAPPPVFPVVDVPPAQVHRLAVEGQGRAVSLVRSSSATWLPEPPTPEASVSLLAESEDAILPLQAFRRLDADGHRADFGLAAPEFVVRITDAAGAEQVVAIGTVTFSGAGSYARREGDPAHVYLLARGTVDALRSVLRGERVTTPRSELETQILSESTDDRDPEEVTNPWLAQVLEEARP
ncbi:MAG TPA: DUF4340 domain-containing protein [Acidimicrobiia bacterium]|nr:DUF4340 domain-containing protein [Acidimicrobiia bacterium]